MTDSRTKLGAAYRILGYFEKFQASQAFPRGELLHHFEADGGNAFDFVVGLQRAVDRGWLAGSGDDVVLADRGFRILELVRSADQLSKR